MTSDHTEKLLDVADVVDGLRPVYFPRNGGREPAEFYWLAFLVWLGVPKGFMLLKLGMAALSTLNIPLMYILGRRVAGRELGLLAALVMAVSYWHVVITRIGLRIAFAPLAATITLLFLYKAVQTGRRNDFLWLGASSGLGLYGYSGFRPMYFVLVLALVLKLLHDAWHGRRSEPPRAFLPRPLARHLAAGATVMILVAAPLIRFAVDRPFSFWGRTATRMLGTEQAMPHPLAQQLAINVRNGLLMFNLSSDQAWFQAAPFRPALERMGGALLVLGVVTALWRLWRFRDWRTGLLLVTVPVMLSSSIMALSFPNENPSFTRAAGALPAVCLLVALPLPILRVLWRSALGRVWGMFFHLVLLFGVMAGMFRGGWHRYFEEYRTSYDRNAQNTSEGSAVARAYMVAAGVDLAHIYVVGWSHGWDYRAIGIELGDVHWNGLLWGRQASGHDAVRAADGHVGDTAGKLYLVGGPRADENVKYLRGLYPTAIATKHPSKVPGKDFWSVYVPARPTEDPHRG